MGHKNREIEKKFIVSNKNLSFKEVCFFVKNCFIEDLWDDEITGRSSDVYWHSPSPQTADFIRIRQYPTGDGQLTLKHSDQGTNVNRIEIDVGVHKSSQAVEFVTKLLGSPIGEIEKDHLTLFWHLRGYAASVYKISSHPDIFIEIEAKTIEDVDNLVGKLDGIELDQEHRSLYQIFFGGKP